jgi:hypothetical protein
MQILLFIQRVVQKAFKWKGNKGMKGEGERNHLALNILLI